ncbi:CheW-like domain protein [uncultured delta proteobacterium]|uniref:CheW-like domain protein n=1 Tax=uncultured delta proteobacterium TaxID=34034 RepID=A0A212J0E0_9DELT|nr:CheW-like domain protein [uncultured delta proteobacterium]
MNKSPEEYFQEQNFSTDVPPDAKPGEFTDAERAFMEKYMGVEAASTLRSIGLTGPAAGTAGDAAGVTEQAAPQEEALDSILRRKPELLMVGFFLGNQEFVVPTLAVQEVIKFAPPARLPAAPSFVAGVINLRGKVTPLIRLRDILGVPVDKENENKFIIVCRRQGLQMGLMIDRVRTMYRVSQDDIEWGIETHLGANVDFISGLLKLREELVGIVSVDRIVEIVIKR